MASADRARIAALDATIAKTDRLIADESEEYLDLKKSREPNLKDRSFNYCE